MKVAHVTSAHPATDVRIFHKMCRSMAQRGWEVCLIAPHDRAEEIDGVRIVPIEIRRRRGGRMLRGAQAAVRAAMAEQPDLMHFHDPELLPWARWLQAKGQKVIFDMHENAPASISKKHWIPRLARPIISKAWRTFERLAMPSMPTIFAEHSYAKNYPWISTSETILNLPVLDELLTIQGQKHAKASAVYIGVIAPERGSLETIEALGLLQDAGMTVRFDLAGPASTSHFEELKSRAQSRALGDFHLYKRLEPSEAWRLASQCHIGLAVLHPLPNYLESYPTKVFEYMALGLPVVTSNFPLYQELVEDHTAGICVDPLNPIEIAEAIKYLLDHPDEAASMGENGRALVRSTFNWATQADKLNEFYARVCA